MLRKNKRGVFFTIIVIFMLTLFFISFTIVSKTRDRKDIQNRVSSLNNFVFSIEQDLPRKLYASTFRIVFLAEKYVIEQGTFVADFNATFQEAIREGTINGVTNGEIEQLMLGVTLPEMLSDIHNKSKKINANVNITSPTLTISQDDPWNLKVTFNAEIFVEDISGLASWNKTAAIVTYVPIKDFEDPVYIVRGNRVSNKMRKSPYEDVSLHLLEHVQNQYYIASTEAPDFLQRLHGNISLSSPYGIESLVNKTNPNLPQNDSSIVDHVYFSDEGGVGCKVAGMPPWFRLDSEHLLTYGASCSLEP